MDDPYYNVGLTDREMSLIIMLIDDEPTSDEDEQEIAGLRRKVMHKRGRLRQRTKEKT